MAGREKSRGRWYSPGRVWSYLLYTLGGAVLALTVGIYGEFLGSMLERLSSDSMDVHSDFDTFWRSADAYRYGRDLYDTGARLDNLNPPLWTVIISPLAFLDTLVAYRVFVQVTVAIVVGYLVWMVRYLEIPGGWASLSTAAALLSAPILGTLALGQIYAFLALGLVAAWILERRRMSVASGLVLGFTIAIKPSLLPLVLWPLVRGRWRHFLATLAGGAGATLFAAVVAGFGTTLAWLRLLTDSPLNTYWDNASLPAATARLFTENQFATNLAELPWTVNVAYGLGLAAIALTAWLARRDESGVGFWALVAASLLAAPIAWHNYLMLLVPGVLVLISCRRYALAFFLLALQVLPPQWPLLWQDGTRLDAIMLTMYCPILLVHWLALLPLRGRKNPGAAED
ncbi:glycosyltransferase family 87 protein [Rubrobacter radiotolerans]|uniref:Glycosyltransferase family 87 protein n=1 Tax=Rubrobacter radiotolerans TaxID=42256 RepID=A0AB35TCS2_RUBRA|nr:glycosyltransferase family 87 protein [Rubrobacter radiotolerans]MDX5894975.1 glycosyltransferase family 87 protein [Rubrobacter radiotolerans]